MNAAKPPVLVVDDHSTNRILLRRQLEALNFCAVLAQNGLEALTLWRNQPFSLIITDCDMPEMDGYALAAAIRAIETRDGLPPIPIIAWSAKILPENRKISDNAGMSDYLPKPATHKEVAEMTGKWIGIAKTQAVTTPAAKEDELPRNEADGISRSVITPKSEAIPVFDPAVLFDILGDDPEAQRELIGNFLKETRIAVGELEQAIAARDADTSRRISHKLKSSARITGALQFAAACEHLEEVCRKMSWLEIQAAHSAFNRAHQRMNTMMTA